MSVNNTTLFDIMAKIFYKVDSLPEVEKEEIYSRCQSNILSLDSIVEEKFSFLDKQKRKLTYNSLHYLNITSLSSYIDNEDEYNCLLVLVYLDRYVDFESSMKDFFATCKCFQKDVYSFQSLNINGMGILLPRFIPLWAKHSGINRKWCNAKPFSLIKNYIWCPDSGNILVSHIYVDINPLGKMDIQEPFRIVCSPLIDKCPYKADFGNENGINYFYINDYFNEIQEVVISRIEKTINYAKEENAAIVLFPEMMISHETQGAITRIIKDDWTRLYPKIIFFPSSEYQVDDKWKNEIIVTNDSGDTIFKYNKQRRYQHKHMKKDGSFVGYYFEPIYPDDRLTILHLNKIGRVGILICADVFDDVIKEGYCQKYDLDVLLIAAYTSGWDLFNRCATVMSDIYCEVLICNTCAAIKDEKTNEVYPIAYYPWGHSHTESHNKQKCKNDCHGCAFCVEFPWKYRDVLDEPIKHKFFE